MCDSSKLSTSFLEQIGVKDTQANVSSIIFNDDDALVKIFPDSDADAEGMRYASDYHSYSSKVENMDCGKFKYDTSEHTKRVGWLTSSIEGLHVEREGY